MTSYRQNSASRGAGFTLVEILVVIVIIGMLAGLTTTVLMSARSSVRNSVVTLQQAQLSMALDEYKNRYGEYPPDFSDDAAVLRHIKKRWPRYDVKSTTQFLEDIRTGCQISSGTYARGDIMGNDVGPNGQHVWDPRRYVSALVFWLGGLPDKNGIPSGFYANPKAPLGVYADGRLLHRPGKATREKPLYAFDRKELAAVVSKSFGTDDGTGNSVVFYLSQDDESLYDESLGAYVYTPVCVQGDQPNMYFRPSFGGGYTCKNTDGKTIPKHVYWGETDTDGVTQACPYARSATDWYEPRRFQIVHPGMDGYFGPIVSDNSFQEIRRTQPKAFCTIEDDDNITNFLQQGTLQSEYTESAGN